MVGWTVAALALLLLATFLLAAHLYVWDALLLLLLSLGTLGVILRRAFYPRWGRAAHPPREVGARAVVRMGAVFLAAVVGLTTRSHPAEADFTLPLCLWLLALASFLATLPWKRSLPLHPPLTRAEGIALVLLLGAAFSVRGLGLEWVPPNLGGDEGTQLLAGLRLIEPPLGNPFATGWYSVPTLSFLVYGAAMRIFGATIAGGRALSAIVGTLTVLATFLLGRAMGGRRVGWVAAVSLAFAAYHIHYSRLASNQIFDPFVGALTIWLLWEAWRTPDTPTWGLAGMVAGLGWYAYFGARWVTFLLVLLIAERALREPLFLTRHRRDLLLLSLGWLVVVLPLLGWYTAHPNALYERYNAVSIFASGWLEREVALTGKSALTLLLRQFWKAATAFHLTPDPTFWYRPERPLVDFITGALMLVGMLAAGIRWRWPGRSATLIWFWSTLVMGWVLTENPPSSQRGLLLTPAVALLVAWGVEGIWEVTSRRRLARVAVPPWGKEASEVLEPLRRAGGGWLPRHPVRVALLAALGVASLLNLHFYFAVYTPRRVYGNPTAEMATAFARFARAHPLPGSVVYFFGPPDIYWEFGTLAFLLRDQPGVNVMPGECPQGLSPPVRFVFTEARADELAVVQQRYPGGQPTPLVAPDGRPLAWVYDWR